MSQAEDILRDLQRQAGDLTRDFDLESKVADAKKAGAAIKDRLETDPTARKAAAGAGGLLLLGLLGSRSGRRLIGGIAKTGAAAALGALAYRAWNERRGAPSDSQTPADFLVAAQDDPDFALAIVRAMLASAYADGVIDSNELNKVEGLADQSISGAEKEALFIASGDSDDDIKAIAAAATTPNRAAQLYAAACLTAGDANASESEFLARLADRLGIGAQDAYAIRNA